MGIKCGNRMCGIHKGRKIHSEGCEGGGKGGAPEDGENLLKNLNQGKREISSFAELMSPEDAERYLKFLEAGSTEGLTRAELEGIKKVDALLALNMVDYQDILDMRNAKNALEGGSKTVITPEMEEKILFGQRKNPAKNELIGGHSPDINNSKPNYAVEVLQTNLDGTQKVKFVTQYSDGNLFNIKTSTLFPDRWSNNKIINSIKAVGASSPIGVRTSDGAMLYRDIIDGVQIEVIKIGDTVISGYPTGGLKTGLLPGFSRLE